MSDDWGNSPPGPRSAMQNHPTLLFSWWCTSFAATLIIIRVISRKIRTNRFFREDMIMAASMIPLFIRMGLIQVVLRDGTNNTTTFGLSELDIRRRERGSKYVLAARIFFAMFIWMSKFTVSEFLKRTFYNTWRRSYERILFGIRMFLVATFIAVVIATLGECHPLSHAWQVVPDPGPECRQGYAQLITMGAADIITDILLIAFPIPIIIRSQVSLGRKSVLIMLFSASALLIGITGARVPKIIEMHGLQQYRTVWASIEILLSAFVSNAIILGSFARGKGIKRNKYRAHSVSDSIERAPIRRAVPLAQACDNEEEMFHSIGCRMPKELAEEPEDFPTPAKVVPFDLDLEKADEEDQDDDARRDSRWDRIRSPLVSSNSPGRWNRESTRDLAAFLRSTPRASPLTPAGGQSRPDLSLRISDVGGLLDDATHNSWQLPPDENAPLDVAAASSQRPTTRSLLSDLRSSLGVVIPRSRSNSAQRLGGRTSTSRPPLTRELPRFDSESTTPVNNPGDSEPGSIEMKDVGGLLK